MKYNVLFTLIAVLALAGTAYAEAPPPRAVSVNAQAHMEIAPDQAILSGQLVSRNKQLNAAKEANDALVAKVVEIAKEFEIPRDKVSASNVYIAPEYQWNAQTNKQIQIGYIVSRNLTITINKLDIHERVLSALVDKGIDQINGVSFAIAKPEEFQNTLRIQAVQNARTQAESLAKAAGAKLGKVLTIISNSSGYAPQPMPLMARAMSDAKEISFAPSLPGLTTLSEAVSVTFELE